MCFPDGMQNSDHVVHWPQLQPLSQTCWPHILCKGRNIIPTSILEHPEVVTFQVYNLFGKSYHFTALGISNYSACDKFPKTSSTYPSSVATTMPGMMMRNKGRKPGKHLGKRLPGNIFAKHSKINKNPSETGRVFTTFPSEKFWVHCVLLKVSKVFTLVGVSNPSENSHAPHVAPKAVQKVLKFSGATHEIRNLASFSSRFFWWRLQHSN